MLCFEGTGAITHFTHRIFFTATTLFYVLMNRYCTVVVLSPLLPNALCVKSQDVCFVLFSLTKGKLREWSTVRN